MTIESSAPSIVIQPGVGEAYGNGWRQLWKNFLELLLVIIITWAFGAPTAIYSAIDSTPGFEYVFFSFAFNILVLLPLGYGTS